MSCIVTSSRIFSAHNTKQNKCPLLIKPHNKCRPFVFPFILSTQGEHRNGDLRTATRIKSSRSCSLAFLLFGQRGVVSLWLLLLLPCYLQHIYILSILKFITNNATDTKKRKQHQVNSEALCRNFWILFDIKRFD